MCIVACMLLLTVTTNAQEKVDQEVMADAEKAKVMLQTANDKLDGFFENSTGYAIFPNVGEGGLIVGGASGNGVVYENGEVVGMADLKKVDVGLQAGGQAINQVIFFETEEALNEFKQGELELQLEHREYPMPHESYTPLHCEFSAHADFASVLDQYVVVDRRWVCIPSACRNRRRCFRLL